MYIIFYFISPDVYFAYAMIFRLECNLDPVDLNARCRGATPALLTITHQLQLSTGEPFVEGRILHACRKKSSLINIEASSS